MGSLLVCFFYYSLGLENSSAYCKVSCYSAFKCGERETIPQIIQNNWRMSNI